MIQYKKTLKYYTYRNDYPYWCTGWARNLWIFSETNDKGIYRRTNKSVRKLQVASICKFIEVKRPHLSSTEVINLLDKHNSSMSSLEEERFGKRVHLTSQLSGVYAASISLDMLLSRSSLSLAKCPMLSLLMHEQLFIPPVIRCWSILPCKEAEEEEACWQWNCTLESCRQHRNSVKLGSSQKSWIDMMLSHYT